MKNTKLMFEKSVAILIFLVTTFAYSQTKPFPANVNYGNGLTAASKNSQDASASYDIWKTNFIEACSNGRFRVKFDNSSQTVSEGIAYGMLLTAYKGDKTTFDGLWLYYKDNVNSHGVMNWKINGCSGAIGQNGATDAELDAAMALIVADYQWGSAGTINYKTDGTTLIGAIKQFEVEATTFVLKPGDMFGGTNLTNPSYLAPGYYRAFGQFTNDVAYWNSVATKSYQILNANLTQNNAVGGLVSDWCKADGTYSNDAGGYANGGKKYTYDAARTPWRIAVDYLWYGTPAAQVYAKKCSDFVRVNLNGTANIVDGYNQDGSPSSQYHNATFVGAFACAATAGGNQAHMNASYDDLKNLNEPNSYFNQTLKTMYQFLLTGNFYLPATVSTLATENFASLENVVNVYPNPSNATFTIESPVKASYKVSNALGQVIAVVNETDKCVLHLDAQPTGVYLLEIEYNGTKSYKKLLLQ